MAAGPYIVFHFFELPEEGAKRVPFDVCSPGARVIDVVRMKDDEWPRDKGCLLIQDEGEPGQVPSIAKSAIVVKAGNERCRLPAEVGPFIRRVRGGPFSCWLVFGEKPQPARPPGSPARPSSGGARPASGIPGSESGAGTNRPPSGASPRPPAPAQAPPRSSDGKTAQSR